MNELACLLVRHGLTKGNIEKRYIGCHIDEELCEQGIRELREGSITDSIVDIRAKVCDAIETDGVWPVAMGTDSKVYVSPMLRCAQTTGSAAFSKVYVSPMLRCVQTADILFPGAEQIVSYDFREMDFGEFENKNYEELSGNKQYQEWIASNGTIAFPGGENRADFIERTVRAFRDIVLSEANCSDNAINEMNCSDNAINEANCSDDSAGETNPGERTVPFVIHGGSIMAIMSTLTGGEYFDYQLSCGEAYVVRIRIDEDDIDVISYNRLYNRRDS